MKNIERVRGFFRARDIEILSVDWNKDDELCITTSKLGVLTSNEIPELDELSIRQIRDLKKEFSLKAEGVQKIIIEAVNTVKDNVNSTINDFIRHIVETKQNYADSAASNEIASIISEIDDVGIKTRLQTKLKDNDMFVREFIDIVKSSYVDKLTGIFGQNHYQHFFGKGYDNFRRASDIEEYNVMLNMLNDRHVDAVMFCDLNNFKAVNDLVSHEAGDEILKNFAQEMKKFTKTAIPIRSGGDEFIILGQVEELEALARYMDSDEFIANINKSMPIDVKLFDKPLRSTVSKGVEGCLIPRKIFDMDGVMDFKKDFGRVVSRAEIKSVDNKNKIKESLGIGDYRSSTTEYLDSGGCDELSEEQRKSALDDLIDDKSLDLATD